jgi:hypothetical protein
MQGAANRKEVGRVHPIPFSCTSEDLSTLIKFIRYKQDSLSSEACIWPMEEGKSDGFGRG